MTHTDKMETVEGTPAKWPVTHTFYDISTDETYHIHAESAGAARSNLFCTLPYTDDCVTLQYMRSVDADKRFVYDVLN